MYLVPISYVFKYEHLSPFIYVMPLRNERDRPRKMPVDEEAALAPFTPPSQVESKASSEFPAPPMPQPDFLLPITLEVCLAYASFWYVQAQFNP